MKDRGERSRVVLGREPPRLRYECFEHVQNLRSAVVVKNGRTGSVVRSWKQRSKVGYHRVEVVVDACYGRHVVISDFSTLAPRSRHDLATTVLRPIRCYHAFTTPIP